MKKRANHPGRNQTTQEIADLLDVDPSTILAWVQLGLPCDEPRRKKESHKFNPAEVSAWMRDNRKTGLVGRPPEEANNELRSLKIRKEGALVERYERENAVENGKLIDAATEEQRDLHKITTLRNHLRGLGATLSPQLDGLNGAQRQTLIDEAIDEAIREFGDEK